MDDVGIDNEADGLEEEKGGVMSAVQVEGLAVVEGMSYMESSAAESLTITIGSSYW